jgi:hypothetical protein
MTLVKLHACQYRKVKSFPDIGVKLSLNLHYREPGSREQCPEMRFLSKRGGGPTNPLAAARLVGPAAGWLGFLTRCLAVSAHWVAWGSAAMPLPLRLRPNQLLGRRLLPRPPYATPHQRPCQGARSAATAGRAAVQATIPGTGAARFLLAADAARPGAGKA